MKSISIKPERKAQLEEYARRRGQDAESALDVLLASYFERDRQDYSQAVEGIRRGLADVKAGRTRPAKQLMEELCQKQRVG